MKNLIFLSIILSSLSVLAFAESYRETTSGMHMESYMAMMRRQTGASTAEIQADEYRSRYEICDEHHNCTNVTAGTTVRPAEKHHGKDQIEPVRPFVHVPVWM